jgi:hypothetical protein
MLKEFPSHAINGLTENGKLTNVLGGLGGPVLCKPDHHRAVSHTEDDRGAWGRFALMAVHLKRVSQWQHAPCPRTERKSPTSLQRQAHSNDRIFDQAARWDLDQSLRSVFTAFGLINPH